MTSFIQGADWTLVQDTMPEGWRHYDDGWGIEYELEGNLSPSNDNVNNGHTTNL